ncbi:MAG: biosynthetic arginine decarboxylase [Parachlamydiaceae bacterium]|nr:biosynthetic arginine decarboxylase [Parachlamydiaceae bacterium]
MPEENHYSIDRWGDGYFNINALGHVEVKPNGRGKSGDLYELVQTLVAQGIEAPILVRFNGIIQDRISKLSSAFKSAIEEFEYRNIHQIVFPLKVNPQKHVVEAVREAGQKHKIGLEVGSKPELIAVLAIENEHQSLLMCNGYKDAEYISLALLTCKLGRRTVIIIEQMYELNLVLEMAAKVGVEAEIGFRMKLSNSGSGRWKESSGEHSKFGLFTYEIVSCLEILKKQEKSHWVKLLHFHLGSQVTSIESFKNAIKEGTRIYTELSKMLPSLHLFDVGGGLAVDYDGTKSKENSSMDYTLEEYARDVVFTIGESCLAAGVNDPVIITESGRALVSHHSILITEVLDVTSLPHDNDVLPPSQHDILQTLDEMEEELSLANCRESFHDLLEIKQRILQEFIYGTMTLLEHAYAEKKTRYLLVKVNTFYQQLRKIPEETAMLNSILQETYFCNFSVFQSLPDSWAIQQLFPIMPIHRLNEIPTHQAILADLSCDSDGKICAFINDHSPAAYLKLHEYTGQPYYIGIFMVGAYQEILGGMHNLFGDTNVVHAELDKDGQWELFHLVEGDTIEEVLHYVQFEPEKLIIQLQALIEQSLKAKRISLSESAQIKKKFKEALQSYTYLVV